MRWLVVVLLLATSCGNTAPAPDAAPVAKPLRKGGRIRVADKFVAIVPEVIHEAHMDLFVGCKQIIDQAKADGHGDVPLCYEAKPRALDGIKTIRVEYRNGTAADAMRELAQGMEATHFIVESAGSMYQLLDLAYAERRAGANRGDEIRILSMGGKDPHGNKATSDALAAALAELYPQAHIQEIQAVEGAKP